MSEAMSTNNVGRLFSITSKMSDATVTYTNTHDYYVAMVLNDLKTKMSYQREFKTASSIVYSANIATKHIFWYAQLNKKTIVNLSFETGWQRKFYLNVSVDVLKTNNTDLYNLLFMAIFTSIALFDKNRELSAEEEVAVKEVLTNKEKYNTVY